MAAKRPWMPFYIDDYLAATGHLEAHEHGAYLLLILRYWSKGSLPEDEDQIRRISRLDERQWKKSVSVLKSFFSPEWKHERMDRDLKKVIEKSSVNSANAKKSHLNRNKVASDFGSEDPAFGVQTPSEDPANDLLLQTPYSIKKEEGANAPSPASGLSIGSLIHPNFTPSGEAIASALNVDGISPGDLSSWLDDWKGRCIEAGTRLDDWHAAWGREYHRRMLERAAKKPKPRVSVSKKRLEKIPDGWAPGVTHHKIAGERSLNIIACLESFSDYLVNKRPDWKDVDAAFRQWLKSPHRTEFTRNGQAQPTRRAPAPGGSSILDAFDRLDATIVGRGGAPAQGQPDGQAIVHRLPEE